MKTIFYFENEVMSVDYHIRAIRSIREKHPEEVLAVIGAGDFSADGALLEPSGKERAGSYIQEGADLVLTLPAASILGGYGKKEFAGAALVQALHTDECLVIPCVPLPGQTPEQCEQCLRTLAMGMLKEENGYRRKLNENLNQDMSFRQAQRMAVCDGRAEAEALLAAPENAFALWLLDSMVQLYYMAKTEFVRIAETVSEREASQSEELPGGSKLKGELPGGSKRTEEQSVEEANFKKSARQMFFEKKVIQQVAELLDTWPAEQWIDISGSTAPMVEALLAQKDEIQKAESLDEIRQMLRPVPKDRLRQFLLKAVLGIRKIDAQICGLHTFAPYLHVAAENPDKSQVLKQMEEASWIPWIRDFRPQQPQTERFRHLLRADQGAENLAAPEK